VPPCIQLGRWLLLFCMEKDRQRYKLLNKALDELCKIRDLCVKSTRFPDGTVYHLANVIKELENLRRKLEK